MNQNSTRTILLLLLLAVGLLGSGCGGSEPGVVLYTDQDKKISEALEKQVEAEIRVPVHVVYARPEDVQNGIGLAQRIREESGSRKADVYWADNQIAMQTLVDDGLLERAKTPQTIQFPAEFRNIDFRWVGMGARVRVLLYNKQALKAKTVPLSLASLAAPAWKGRAAFADPRKNGSARYHLTVLFAHSEDDATDLLAKMKANGVQFLPNETAVVEAVASGKAAWGITDSDLAEAALRAKQPVEYVVPDQKTGVTAIAMGLPASSLPSLGTPLLISSLGLLNERHAPEEGKRLFNALVTLQTVTAQARLQPGRLATHESLISSPPPNGPRIKDARSLRLAQPSPSKIDLAQTRLSQALAEVLGNDQ